MEDHYRVFGLQRTATGAEIRQAYKQCALRWHPDKNPGDRASAEAMFKKIAAAYKVLIDPAQRRLHDAGPSPQLAAERRGAAAPKGVAPSAAPGRPAPAAFPAATAGGVQEAYNLFEEVFGKDPFKDMDSLFQDPTLEGLDRFFAGTFPAERSGARGTPAGTTSTRTERTVAGKLGVLTVSESIRTETVEQQAAAAPAPPPLPASFASNVGSPGHWRARCLASAGLAYRRSMNLADRLEEARGPGCGDVLHLLERRGDWLRVAGGWLPLTIGGKPVMEVLTPSTLLQARCSAAAGVAYRASMDINNRLVGVRGPNCGEVVVIEERLGGWLRCASGWLPLVLGDQPVFELLEDKQALPAAPTRPPEPSGRLWDAWRPWQLALSSGAVGLLAVLGTGSYVALRVSSLLVRGWWRATFGMLPRVW